MKIGRRISSFDAWRVIAESFNARRLKVKDSISASLKSRLSSSKDDKARATQIGKALEEATEYKFNAEDDVPYEDDDALEDIPVEPAEEYDEADKIIFSVDTIEYRTGQGRSIRIMIDPELKGVSLYVMITADTGLVEKGYLKPSADEPGCWLYNTKIRRPALFDMAICVWVCDEKDVLAEKIVQG